MNIHRIAWLSLPLLAACIDVKVSDDDSPLIDGSGSAETPSNGGGDADAGNSDGDATDDGSDDSPSGGTDTPGDDGADDEPTDPTDPAPSACDMTFGGFEVCDGDDNDCNGSVDDGCQPYNNTNIPELVDLEDIIPGSMGLDLSEWMFTSNGDLVTLTDENRAIFLTRDGDTRGGGAKALDQGTTYEDPIAGTFHFVHASHDLIGMVQGEWTEVLPGSPQDRIEEGTTFFEIDENTGARRNVIGRIEDQFLEWAAFRPDGTLVGYTTDDNGPAAGGSKVLYLDVLGTPVELSPPQELSRIQIAPDGQIFACMSQGGTDYAVIVDDDGDLEDAFGSSSLCPDAWAFDSSGYLYFHETPSTLVAMDHHQQNKRFSVWRNLTGYDSTFFVAPHSDWLWIMLRPPGHAASEQLVYYVPLGED